MSDLPRNILGIIHRIIYGIENRYKSLIITLIHVNDIDQRDAHPGTIGVQDPLGPGVLFRLFPRQISLDVVTVYQRGRCIGHVKSGGGIHFIESVCETGDTAYAYNDPEQRQQAHNAGRYINSHIRPYFPDLF